jgi:hypothetical protein
MSNRHERLIAATPGRLAALVADFDAIWPAAYPPAPRPLGDGRYEVPPMIWQEVDRPGAVRAFRVARPEELDAEHWFELLPAEGGTVLRHTIDGEASGDWVAIWRDRIEPAHDLVLEGLLDRVEAAVA